MRLRKLAKLAEGVPDKAPRPGPQSDKAYPKGPTAALKSYLATRGLDR